jgi:hypothetical protein
MQENTRPDGTLIAGAALLGGAALLANTQTASARPKANPNAISPALTFSQIDGQGDIKVLNYALALEALEADLYVQALQRLTTGGTNGLGQTITGLGLSDSNPLVTYTRQFGVVERQHRDYLISALGDAAITNGSLAGANFDFGINSLSEQQLLDFLILVEDTGTSAYLGAIPRFRSYRYLPVAGAIQGTEARHTAALIVIRNLTYGPSSVSGVYYTPSPAPLDGQGLSQKAIDLPVDPDTVRRAVSPYIVLPTSTPL